MATRKQYADPQNYEAKLEKVMSRLGVDQYDYDWSRKSCWVEFFYNGSAYRFSHSVENAKAHGIELLYGSDVFAQVVLTLEDLARMVERGIYDLTAYIAGMKYLPESVPIDDCFIAMQFEKVPTIDEVKARYRQLAKVAHPDKGGSEEQFTALKNAYDRAMDLLKEE